MQTIGDRCQHSRTWVKACDFAKKLEDLGLLEKDRDVLDKHLPQVAKTAVGCNYHVCLYGELLKKAGSRIKTSRTGVGASFNEKNANFYLEF